MNISVRLLQHTPNPVRTMALAARLCYVQGMSIEQVDKGLTDEKAEEMVKKILANQHLSVLEHASFTFGVEGVSRNFTHQLVRHRNTSYEQQSLHYTLAPKGIQVAKPPKLTALQEAEWDLKVREIIDFYRKLVDEGVPREEARHILPSGVETKIIMTSNLRQWLHFVKLRACVVNCHEITVVAMRVKRIIESIIPFMEPHLGPTCHTEGVCYEGKKFCKAPWKEPCVVKGV